MKRICILVIAIGLFSFGCTKSQTQEQKLEENIIKKIQTPEIIRVLEEENINLIFTSHDQTIYIKLEDGQQFEGKYIHSQAGKYSDNEHLFDILNLVNHIEKIRNEKWKIACE